MAVRRGWQPWHDNLVDHRWRSTRSDAGVTYKLHEQRHYFASGLIAAGCDVVTVQRIMGHASATTTLSTYAHLRPTAEDKTRAAAAGMAVEVLAAARPSAESSGSWVALDLRSWGSGARQGECEILRCRSAIA